MDQFFESMTTQFQACSLYSSLETKLQGSLETKKLVFYSHRFSLLS